MFDTRVGLAVDEFWSSFDACSSKDSSSNSTASPTAGSENISRRARSWRASSDSISFHTQNKNNHPRHNNGADRRTDQKMGPSCNWSSSWRQFVCQWCNTRKVQLVAGGQWPQTCIWGPRNHVGAEKLPKLMPWSCLKDLGNLLHQRGLSEPPKNSEISPSKQLWSSSPGEKPQLYSFFCKMQLRKNRELRRFPHHPSLSACPTHLGLPADCHTRLRKTKYPLLLPFRPAL